MKPKCCNQEYSKPDGAYLEELVGKICTTYKDARGINHIEGFNLPRQQEIFNIINKLLEIVFPGFSGTRHYSMKTIFYSIGNILSDVYAELLDQVIRSLRYRCVRDHCDDCDIMELSEEAVRALLDQIPAIRETMKQDIAAAYDGDPAAVSMDEIVVSYPGVRALTIQRFAHVLYRHKVPLIPRMMTEYAHGLTGIDIHPGAQLGDGVFIDHGTGVVIGETAIIGDSVKIYQGVTLGALSFPKDACGDLIRGTKRHPTIDDGVTIYSGATVLGDVTIGRGAIIGGNVWITEDIPPGTKVIMNPPENKMRPTRVKR